MSDQAPQHCLEQAVVPTWDEKLAHLCEEGETWALIQCLTALALLRMIASGDDAGRAAWEKARGDACLDGAFDSLVAGLIPLPEDAPLDEGDAAFLAEVARALPARLESWAQGRCSASPEAALEDNADAGLCEDLDEKPLSEGENASSSSSLEERSQAFAAEAATLFDLVEGLCLHKAECLDAAIRTCLAYPDKTAGSFSTPECVMELLASMLQADLREASSLYDPCAGSGLLLSACSQGQGRNAASLKVFAQERDPEAFALLKMRSIAWSLASEDAPHLRAENRDLRCGDVLAGAWHKQAAPFDVIVSHVPMLSTWPGEGDERMAHDGRFACAGELAPKSAADLAFVLHAYHCLSVGGTAALVVYPASLRRGGAERTIRRYLLEQNAVDAVIQLPAHLFSDSSMTANVLVLRKGREKEDVLFVDALHECSRADGRTLLSPRNIERIVGAFEAREDIDGFARSVSMGEIVRKAWSLTAADYFTEKAHKITLDTDFLKRTTDNLTELFAVSGRRIDGIFR